LSADGSVVIVAALAISATGGGAATADGTGAEDGTGFFALSVSDPGIANASSAIDCRKTEVVATRYVAGSKSKTVNRANNPRLPALVRERAGSSAPRMLSPSSGSLLGLSTP
jgi:hypothetical protein